MQVTSRKLRRYQLNGQIAQGDVSLTILNANKGDNGAYCCRIEVSGWFNDIKKTLTLQVDIGEYDYCPCSLCSLCTLKHKLRAASRLLITAKLKLIYNQSVLVIVQVLGQDCFEEKHMALIKYSPL